MQLICCVLAKHKDLIRETFTYEVAKFFSVAYPGCLSQFRIFPIPDPESTSKNLSILTQKIVSKLSEIWSVLFIPGSWILIFYPSRIQASKRHRIPDPQHCNFLIKYWGTYPGSGFENWLKFRPRIHPYAWLCLRVVRAKLLRAEKGPPGRGGGGAAPPPPPPAPPTPRSSSLSLWLLESSRPSSRAALNRGTGFSY